MLNFYFKLMLLVALVVGAKAIGQEPETLLPLDGAAPPHSFEEMWKDFDPRAEPLDVETLHEWEEDGVVMRVLRYRIGVFKCQKAMMAAVYGYPKDGRDLPGLVQIHGGGQFADYRAVFANARRGYATISIAWAGRISTPDYRVSEREVKLFWEGKTDDPNYRTTTDWGPLDAYHAPCRNPKNGFASVKPAAWTLDPVDSPRNNAWFLCTLAARRALTFLEQQPEVNGNKLGVYGHSMGGKITVMTTAADSRVKAAAPSCGGISNRPTDNDLYAATIHDGVSLKHISCPIIFLSPANDFHGHIDDLARAVTEIQSDDWRVTCAPHHNHQDTAQYMINGLLWMDQYLQGTFTLPETPRTSLVLKTDRGVPSFTAEPDASKQILSVDIYYTQQGQTDGGKDDRENTKHRFWHHADAKNSGNVWTADLPLVSTDRPLWVYANVDYALEQPETGAGYYYSYYTADRFTLSSVVRMVSVEELKTAGVQATLPTSLLIEAFEDGWQNEWFSYKPELWGRSTHKVYDDRWKAPEGAKLAFDVRSAEQNAMVVGLDDYAAEVQLAGQSQWQTVELTPDDFMNASGAPLPDWSGIKELRLGAEQRFRSKDRQRNRTLGGDWEGPKPDFRNLRWITESP